MTPIQMITAGYLSWGLLMGLLLSLLTRGFDHRVRLLAFAVSVVFWLPLGLWALAVGWRERP